MEHDCEYRERDEPEQRTNYDMVKDMNSLELAAWVAVQIKKYYEADNTVIFDEEVNRIVDIYINWFDQPVYDKQ